MSFLASLAMLAVVLPQGTPAPQNGGQENTAGGGKAPLLTPADHETLRKALAKYLADDATYRSLEGDKREKASQRRDKSKDSFEDEWRKAEKKGNLLGSMADLRPIFENCFTVKPATVSFGNLRKESIKDLGLDYYFYLPKTYKADKPTRTVMVMPGTTAATGTDWVKAQDYFTAVWDKANLLTDTLVHVASVPANFEFDPVPDYSRQGAEEEEDRRIRTVFGALGDLMQGYNLDRARLFLDCGRGSCGFALRLMTLFPDRFAGVVLRAPIEVDDIRLGSLTGSNVLLLRTPATATVVDALKKRLDEAAAGSATVLDAADEYPHPGSAAAIETWLKERRRNMVPTRVVLEPNHDRHNRAYWVDILTADSLLTAPPDKRPRLEVEADPKANRIVVKAVGVERFTLLLNDDLVDLDKEFTVVINDKPVAEKRTRSFSAMRDRVVSRSDWDYLFPVEFSTTAPKE